MEKQQGFAFIPVILGLFAVMILGSAGAAALALTGKAPTCPAASGSARSEDAIGNALENGSITITDGEATALAKGYVGEKVSDPRVCFTKDLGHISGKINLGGINPSFYVSGGVDLTGSIPKATNLQIQLGSLPNNPVVSSLAQTLVNKFIEQGLEKISLDQKYSAEFSQGSVTVRK